MIEKIKEIILPYLLLVIFVAVVGLGVWWILTLVETVTIQNYCK